MTNQTLVAAWEATAILLGLLVITAAVIYGAHWYKALGRSRFVFRDPTIGQDHHRAERRAKLQELQADRVERRHLNALVEPRNGPRRVS